MEAKTRAALDDFSQDLTEDQRRYLDTCFAAVDIPDPALVPAAAAELLQHHREGRSAEAVAAVMPQVLSRAWARVRAREGRPTMERAGLPDVEAVRTTERKIGYLGYFALEDNTYEQPRFDGGRMGDVPRMVFMMADAVTVLPYDPVRDRVLVVEQLRYGPLLRGDRRPWVLEPIAGRVDAGEGPEATARREAEEEAGVTLGALHLIGEHYVSPGAVTECLISYVGEADLPDDITGISGLDVEQEDIRSHLLSFDRLMELCDAGALDTGPLFLAALWLSRHRDRLREARL
ncbi:NUDIX domain-containing protein [Celeribacter sp.]|uniref:NUDIX domain-containing protein n=1 Tax=Celeribacter sp. TaxID=1890673 RepID=UPI003A8F6E44